MHHILHEEHKQLKDLLYTINTHMSKGHSIGIILKFFNNFITLASQHFKNEEKIMNISQYPEAVIHKQEHDSLINQLETMQCQLNGGQTPFGKDFIVWQKNWIEEHLSNSDKKLIDFLKTKENLKK